MVQRIGLGIAAIVLALAAGTPAMADASKCGLAPFPPEFPSLNDMARLAPQNAAAAKHQAFEDVINWQKGLKTFRGCLDTLMDDDNRKITLDKNGGSKDDVDEIKDLQSDVSKINTVYNDTVDTEKAIVGNYNSISKAYCARKDVDQSSCQQAQ